MAVSVKQSTGVAPVQSGPGSTTLTCTLPALPTVGNLLVFLMAGDKNTGALTLPGFTQQHEILGASASLYYYRKTSDGTETSISPVWANISAAGNTAWYAELQDTAITGITNWQVSATPASLYSESATQARSSGTTGFTTAAGLAIAAWGVDDDASLGLGTRAYSNSYTEVVNSQSGGGDPRGALFGAIKSIAQGAATECTFSYSGFGTTGDQIAGCVAVFSKLANVPGNSSGAFSVLGGSSGSFSVRDGSSGGWEVIGGSSGDMVGKGDSEGDMAGLGSSSGTFTKGV